MRPLRWGQDVPINISKHVHVHSTTFKLTVSLTYNETSGPLHFILVVKGETTTKCKKTY